MSQEHLVVCSTPCENAACFPLANEQPHSRSSVANEQPHSRSSVTNEQFLQSLQCFVYDHSAYAAGVWSTPTFVQVSVTIYSYLYAVSDSSPGASWSQWYWHGRNLQQCFNCNQSLDFVVYLDPWTNSFVSEVSVKCILLRNTKQLMEKFHQLKRYQHLNTILVDVPLMEYCELKQW